MRHGIFHLIDDPVLIKFLLIGFVIIVGDGLGIFVPDGTRRLDRPVEPGLDIEILIHVLVETASDAHVDIAEVREMAVDRIDHAGVHDLAVFNVDEEFVCLHAAGDTSRLFPQLLEIIGQMDQDIVARLPAVELIDQMEVVDIQEDRVHDHILVELVELLRVAVEVLLVEQSCQILTFRGLDDASVFVEFDGLLHAGEDDIRNGEWLQDEIRSAHLQGVDLCGVIGGEYDDRQIGVIIAGLHPLDHFEAVHVRHPQIHEDQRQQIPVLLDLLDGFFAVARHEAVEVLLDDVPQHFPVDLFVIDDEDQPLAGDRMEFHMTFQHSRYLA